MWVISYQAAYAVYSAAIHKLYAVTGGENLPGKHKINMFVIISRTHIQMKTNCEAAANECCK